MNERHGKLFGQIFSYSNVLLWMLGIFIPFLGYNSKSHKSPSALNFSMKIKANQGAVNSNYLGKLSRSQFIFGVLVVMHFTFGLITAESINMDRVDLADYWFNPMECKIAALDAESDEFKILRKYMKSSASNDDYQIHNIYAVDRPEERENIKKWEKYGNKMLLWHGTKPENVVGILQTGFRIAPAESLPYKNDFGYGVYFSDAFSKAAKFTSKPSHRNERLDFSTWLSRQQKKWRYLFVCQVVLGNQQVLYKTQDVKGIPNSQMQSVKVMGEFTPDPSESMLLGEGVVIPIGHLIKNEQPQKFVAEGNYHWAPRENEYVVYDSTQLQIKYLVEIY